MPYLKRLSAVVAILVVVLAGCSQSNDPADWVEAEAQAGFPVQTNFIDACVKANVDQDDMSAAEAESFCSCAFDEVRESLTFEKFKQLDDDLRADAEDLPAAVRAQFEGCVGSSG